MPANTKIKSRLSRNFLRRPAVLLAIAIVASIGVYLVARGHAQSGSVSIEAENGTLSQPATVRADSGASGGNYVVFSSPATQSGCTVGTVAAPCIGGPATGAAGWGAPVFADEFNGTSLDTGKWSPCWFSPTCGSMNNVKTSPSNVQITGGNLVLTLSSSGSGALVSSDPHGGATTGYEFTTGYYAEARVYFPGSGSNIYNWPAWWTDGQSWPKDGEIDIAEGLGTLTTNYHSPSGASNSPAIPGTWSNAFHIYGVDREAGTNYIYWDGNLVRSYATNDGGAPQYLIFNVGSGHTPALGTASQVKVDYVRVWRH